MRDRRRAALSGNSFGAEAGAAHGASLTRASLTRAGLTRGATLPYRAMQP